jgi:8-amino-7-oxononanoate synthase
MTAAALKTYETYLHGLERKDRLRELTQAQGIDFTSNDYLAFSGHPRLKATVRIALEEGVPVGAGGSRLLRGNHPEHEALEEEAARFFQAKSALFFGSGYLANFALLSTLPQKIDLIVYDELIHASAHDGMRAGRAHVVAAKHNEVSSFEQAIRDWRTGGGKGRVWIAVESLYSMDGDQAPLEELTALANRHDAFLLIDEAHATGVYGPQGRGLAADLEGQENVICLHTCGKALGVSGGIVTLSALLRAYLVNRARPFIYATAPSPLMTVAVREVLRILQEEPEHQKNLQSLIAFANDVFAKRLDMLASGSQILPIIIGDNARAVSLAQKLRQSGFDLRAIRPPTVPEGTARLRASITLQVNHEQVTGMFDTLARAMEV